jgi:hypothetical protein
MILLVMEYLFGGPIEWANANDQPILLLKQTRRILRDVLLGLEYRVWPFNLVHDNSSFETTGS